MFCGADNPAPQSEISGVPGGSLDPAERSFIPEHTGFTKTKK